MEQVVLVDEADADVGVEERWRAHSPPGLLHRAFSVLVVDAEGRVLLQRRSDAKRTFPGRWANTCCGHPRPGEDLVAAAERRLAEEMGLDVPLAPIGSFTYRAEGGDWVEHELDHVMVGRFDGHPSPDPDEASDWRWASPEQALADAAAEPSAHAPWLEHVLRSLLLEFGGGEPD